MSTAGERLSAALDLEPLTDEGGRFRRTFADSRHSTILFLLADGDFSALHRLTAPEDYHYLAGAPLQLLLIDERGPREIRLGRFNPSVRVEPGCWQGSSSSGDWTLVSTEVTPPFEWEMFELGDRETLQREHPAMSERIANLTRVQP